MKCIEFAPLIRYSYNISGLYHSRWNHPISFQSANWIEMDWFNSLIPFIPPSLSFNFTLHSISTRWMGVKWRKRMAPFIRLLNRCPLAVFHSLQFLHSLASSCVSLLRHYIHLRSLLASFIHLFIDSLRFHSLIYSFHSVINFIRLLRSVYAAIVT